MLKWRLLLTTLPVVAAVVSLKVLLDSVFRFNGIIDFTDIALVLTGGIFLIGFMLAGTMADYKESEKLPAELAAQLETLEDSIEHAITVNKTPIDRSAAMAAYRTMTLQTPDYTGGDGDAHLALHHAVVDAPNTVIVLRKARCAK
jgi:predicted membrane protein